MPISVGEDIGEMMHHIDKVKKFLKQSAKVDFSVLNPEWSFIDNFRQVRNLVVHHKGVIKNNDTVNNSDKKFNNIKSFSKGRFTLKQYVSSKIDLK